MSMRMACRRHLSSCVQDLMSRESDSIIVVESGSFTKLHIPKKGNYPLEILLGEGSDFLA